MEISKTVFTFTVLHESGELLTSLEHALSESMFGAAVGQTTGRTTVPVGAGDVKDELLALGNDGEFFNYLTED